MTIKSRISLSLALLISLGTLVSAVIAILAAQDYQKRNFHHQLTSIAEAAKAGMQSQILKGYEASYLISENDPDDGWFFATMENGPEIAINIDHNAELGKTMFFINCLMKHPDPSIKEPLGLAGVGMNIDGVTENLLTHAPGRREFFSSATDRTT